MRKKFDASHLILIICATIIIACVSFTVTGAWFTDTKSSEVSIKIGNPVEITLNDLGSITGKNPGDIVSFESVTLNIPADSSSCFIRLKAEAVEGSVDNFDLSNISFGSGWYNYGNYFYLGNTNLLSMPSQTQLIQKTAGANCEFTLSNIKIGDYAPASDSVNIMVTAQALQSANYNIGNWAVSFGE